MRTTIARRLGALLVVGLMAPACESRSDGSGLRLDLEGRAELSAPDKPVRVVRGDQTLRAGDKVKVVSGSATAGVGDGGRLELRPGSELEVRRVAGSATLLPVLVAGDLLVTAGNQRVTAEAMGTSVRVLRGSARVSRGLSLLVTVYTGSADVESAKRAITVPALRQVVVAAVGLFQPNPVPVNPLPSDSWDLRFLGDAIELSSQLIARSRGFTAQVPAGQNVNASYFGQLLPALAGQPAFADSLLAPDRPPGETLVGAAIVIEGKLGSFTERWSNVFRFREEGAPWGVVAADQQVGRVPLLTSLDAAITRTTTVTTPPTTVAPPRPATTPTTAPRRVAPPVTTPPTTTPPPTPPTTAPPLLNTGLPIDPTVNQVVDALNGVLKGLGRL